MPTKLRGSTLIYGYIAAICLVWGMHAFAPDPRTLIAPIPDDAFYYLNVADHLAAGRGSTFDGINPTNGYHPAWMLVTWLLRLLWAGDDLSFVRVVLVAQMLIAFSALALTFQTLRRLYGLRPALAGVTIATLGAMNLVTGLETPLVALGLALATWAIVTRRSVWVVGLTLVVIALSRLDYALHAAALGCAYVTMRGWRHGWKVFVIPALAGLGYLALNLALYGYPLPVTFYIKAGGVGSAVAVDKYLGHTPLIAFTIIGTVVALTRRRLPGAALLTALGLATLVHYVYLATQTIANESWHMAPYGIAIGAALALLVYTIRFPFIQSALIVLPLLLSVLGNSQTLVNVISGRPPTSHTALYDAGLWLRDNTANDVRVTIASSGQMGYFSDRAVINTDGLINSFATYEAIRDGSMCATLDEWDVDLVGNRLSEMPGDDYTLFVSFPGWWGNDRTKVTVTPEMEVYRGGNVILWRYDRTQCFLIPLE